MLLLLFRLLSYLPLSLLHACGWALGYVVYVLSPSYRKRMRLNMQIAGVEAYLSQTIPEAGKSIFELPFVWLAPKSRVLRKMRIKNWDVVERTLAEKKGVIFLTPHLGCFELAGNLMAYQTQGITVMYRPPKLAALKPLLEGARAHSGMKLAPASLSGVRMLAKALKRGESIGLLPDQVPQNGEGIWAKHFGQDAYTMTLPAKLFQLTGAPIIISQARRLSWGRGYEQSFSRLELSTQTLEQQTQEITHAMESLILSSPSQYFWSYNRYKKPHTHHTSATEGNPV